MKINAMQTAATFGADINEALDYVPSGSCFKNRTGARIDRALRFEDRDVFEHCRLAKRAKSHNGHPVPSKYETKPKSHQIVRDSIRHAMLDEEALDAEYRLYGYAAAGMC